MSDDPELKAIATIIEVMQPLDETSRSRVLEYVLKRLEMSALQADPALLLDQETPTTPNITSSTRRVVDIRTLTAEKQPRSANEMVALIAWYLSEVAHADERSETINVEKVRKYFKMAAFPMPRAPGSALTNSAAAGYLESVSRGEYRLSPVGYNLVVHALPRSNGASTSTKRR